MNIYQYIEKMEQELLAIKRIIDDADETIVAGDTKYIVEDDVIKRQSDQQPVAWIYTCINNPTTVVLVDDTYVHTTRTRKAFSDYISLILGDMKSVYITPLRTGGQYLKDYEVPTLDE